MNKIISYLLLTASIIASAAGIAAFVLLFIPDFNIYWLILSPIIIVCYQIPAALLFWLYRKHKDKNSNTQTESQNSDLQAQK